MSNPGSKLFRVGVRVLVEGHIDVPASGARSARAQVMSVLSRPDVLDQVLGQKVVGHDAVNRKGVIELPSGDESVVT